MRQWSFKSRAGAVAVFAAMLCQCVFGQNADSKETQVRAAKGLPPRATPADYQSHAQAGAATLAAEFMGHSVATPEAIFSTEDYVVVEVGIFGAPEARLKLSFEDFSLRMNGKKAPLPAQPYGLVFKSLKDPDWSPPAPPEGKSKTSFGGLSGGKNDDGSPVVPVHMPIELVHIMEQRVQRAALPEGERVLPEAGLIFFPFRGKTDSIRSLELTYTGPAGKATLALQP